MKQMKKLFLLICLFFAFPVFSQVRVTSVSEAVSIALKNSKDLHYLHMHALQNIKKSNLSFQDFLPSIGFSLSENDTVMINGNDSRSKRIQISLTQPLFSGGKKIAAYKTGRTEACYEYQEYLLEVEKLKKEVAEIFNSIVLQQKVLGIKNDLVETAMQQLKVIEIEFSLGMALETDYMEFLVSLRRIQNEQRQVAREIQRLKRNFNYLVGLDPKIQTDVFDAVVETTDHFDVGPFVDSLFFLAQNSSVELKKLSLAMEVAQNQLDFSRRWFLPNVSLDGSVSFSGNNYPLTRPEYTMKIKVDFVNNPFIPTSASSGTGVKNEMINSVDNSFGGNIMMNTTYKADKDLAETSLAMQEQKFIETKRRIYEELVMFAESHDDTEQEIIFLEDTLAIQEKRLGFMELQLENGAVKHIDYLEALIEIAELKISIANQKNELHSTRQGIEIMAGIPFGGLKDVCKI